MLNLCVADKVAEEKSMEKVRAEVKALEMDLDGYKEAASPEVREKAEIIAAEKKARSQVRHAHRVRRVLIPCVLMCR